METLTEEEDQTKVKNTSVPVISIHHNNDEDDDDLYDTDLEDEKNRDVDKDSKKERAVSAYENTDIGHHTYEEACKKLKVIPLKRIISQLWTDTMMLRYIGLNFGQAKALSYALMHNSKVEKVDLTENSLEGDSTGLFFEILKTQIYITYLNISENIVDEAAASILSEMLECNACLTHLVLSGTKIGDKEITHIITGMQENDTLIHLDLSKNEIGISGALRFSKIITPNRSLKSLNLSWNHIRAAGGVAIVKSLQKNISLIDVDLSWNGLGFEGSLALGEALKDNKFLRKLNLNNNRINWDCVPYIGRGLRNNKSLNILEIGYNPLSLEGCADLLDFISNKKSGIQVLSLPAVPINTKIAYLATKISHDRKFILHHGGILATGDVIGIQRAFKVDPLSRLISYLGSIGFRVVDLFRMFDSQDKLFVSREKFMQGLKKINAPLDEDDADNIADRMEVNGEISFKTLMDSVKNHIRDARKEDMRHEMMEKRKREERKRILHSDVTVNAQTTLAFSPGAYNMYSSYSRQGRDTSSHSPFTNNPHSDGHSSSGSQHRVFTHSASTSKTLPTVTSPRPTLRDPESMKHLSARSRFRQAGRRLAFTSGKKVTRQTSMEPVEKENTINQYAVLPAVKT
ncbi:hypothetical protein LOTGIDRAFT_161559 [Lottia gigantea]|uniref:EF-hand domain-containing protein n=1 Tax=Lottia gigantea TaxID=225164 RepID=V3ZSE5_LOTGI|nr:hypothetical protein LOTGIDRAFT_161559 [Lottia gigantea]ESO94333.1 hypothetical protein LOTGIDRAFT_161559 [Lottia gigantea]